MAVRLRKQIRSTEDAETKEKLMKLLMYAESETRKVPASMDMDRDYKRLKYIRYADDFLIGVIGSKEDCRKMKEDFTIFMRDKLKLELSEEKTLITNAHDSAKFLGYEISVRSQRSQNITSWDILYVFIVGMLSSHFPWKQSRRNCLS